MPLKIPEQSLTQQSFQDFFPEDNADEFFRRQIIEVLNKGEDLPVFPAALNKLRELVENRNASLEEIGKLIETDVGLTTQFIRLANSPAYRGDDPISSTYDALIRIGLNEVRNTVFAAGLISEFKKLDCQVDWVKFWTHNLLVGKLTEKIADIYRPLEGGEYLAGLLHDAGKLVMMIHFPDRFEAALSAASASGREMFEEEDDLFGFNHAFIGGALCSTWSLKSVVHEAIYWHHHPDNQPGDGFLARCIYVADNLATLCNQNIHQSKHALDINDINMIPAWTKLRENKPRRTVYLPLLGELSKARATAQALF